MSMRCNLIFALCYISTASVSSVSIPVIVTSPTAVSSISWKTSLTLQCQTKSWPGTPTYFWKKDGNTIYPNSDERLIFSGTKQSLVLSNATKAQSGEYNCIATELDEYLFESSAALSITVVEPPVIPSAPTASNISSTSLNLAWTGNDAAQYYIVTVNPGAAEVKSTLASISLRHLRPYTLYTITVSAYNTAGTRGPGKSTSIRTDPGAPSGGLEFTVGIRTSTTLQVLWEAPSGELANDHVTGYTLTVHDTQKNVLVSSYSGEEEGVLVTGLQPITQYTLSLAFQTRCCNSSPVTKDAFTVREGETVAPTVIPRTEGSTAPTASIIGAVVGGAILLVLTTALLVLGARMLRRRARRRETDKLAWNDGTLDGRNDLVPVSPPPVYCSSGGHEEAASSHIASVSNSFKFTSPPPAYRSSAGEEEEEEEGSETERSVSTVSNVEHQGGRDTWI